MHTIGNTKVRVLLLAIQLCVILIFTQTSAPPSGDNKNDRYGEKGFCRF